MLNVLARNDTSQLDLDYVINETNGRGYTPAEAFRYQLPFTFLGSIKYQAGQGLPCSSVWVAPLFGRRGREREKEKERKEKNYISSVCT